MGGAGRLCVSGCGAFGGMVLRGGFGWGLMIVMNEMDECMDESM